jgi:hypothetical protein
VDVDAGEMSRRIAWHPALRAPAPYKVQRARYLMGAPGFGPRAWCLLRRARHAGSAEDFMLRTCVDRL